ncbi:MAG: DUF192 domain-containing protein [Candidatus Saccharibacteria bacterium]|nr:DUF192 domain-containing protein [Candidatus Saccharibacteria bacterium]
MEVQCAAKKAHRTISWLIIFGVVGLLVYGATMVVRDMTAYRPLVTIGKGTFRVDLATTQDEQHRGLGGRAELAADGGMLFVFEADSKWEIVMRDMRFPIDIVWLDKEKRVVHVEHNAQPDAEPYEVYRPKVAARYVLEVPAGVAKDKGIREGVQASFELEGRS